MSYTGGSAMNIQKIEDMKKQFNEIMTNKDVEDISYWTEPNNASPTNEEEYLANVLRNIKASKSKIHDIVFLISNKK